MKTTNKTQKAFNYNNSKHLYYDLYEYILLNLESKEIAVQQITPLAQNNKMYVFANNYSPQTTGTQYQQQTYTKLYIENKIEQITKHIQNEQI
jgi:hypothetical protein